MTNPMNSLLPESPPEGEHYRWGYITSASPLQVTLDTETSPIYQPSTLVDVGVGDRVFVLLESRRATILGKVGASSMPIGGIILWAAATAPDGGAWAICDGASFNTSTFAALAVVLGGGTLPDLRDRFPRGVSSGGATIRSTGGSATITTPQLPSHSHGIGMEAWWLAAGEDYIVPSPVTDGDVAANTEAAGTGAAYWPKYYAVNYIIRMA